MKNNAIWFSQHEPTPEQLKQIDQLDYQLVGIPEGQALGTIELKDNGDVYAVMQGVFALLTQYKADRIFGVPSAPVLMQLARTAHDAVIAGQWNAGAIDPAIPFYASWNLQRGGYKHKRWVLAGYLTQASLRWLRTQ